jgi:hypothetical protein
MKTMHEFPEWKTARGGDEYYGPDFNDLFKKAADIGPDTKRQTCRYDRRAPANLVLVRE